MRQMDFSRTALAPGQKLFEEAASLPFEDFRTVKLSEMDPKKLLTSEGRQEAERIAQNWYDSYQMKQADAAVAPVLGVLAGGMGAMRAGKATAPLPKAPQPASASAGKVPLALKAPRMADHHVFPQQFKKFFMQRGINIDDFTVTVGETTHLKGLHGKGNAGLPGKWNQRWLSFIEENPNANSKEIYQFGGKLIDEYNLNNLKLHGYRE